MVGNSHVTFDHIVSVDIVTAGELALEVTTCVAVPVHCVSVSFTVKVYVPKLLTDISDVSAFVLHRYSRFVAHDHDH